MPIQNNVVTRPIVAGKNREVQLGAGDRTPIASSTTEQPAAIRETSLANRAATIAGHGGSAGHFE